MASRGIRDQVAIIGMGCTKFGELWDKGIDDLLTDAATEAAASAGLSIHDLDAFWLGTLTSSVSGVTLSRPLKLDYKPVTRVENFCATGSEALRQAAYAEQASAARLAQAKAQYRPQVSVNASLDASRAPRPANARWSTAERISAPSPRRRNDGWSHENVVTVPNAAKSVPIRSCIPTGLPSTVK